MVKKVLKTPNSPHELSRKARIFSSESFEESTKRIVKDDLDGRSRQHRRQGALSTTFAEFPDATGRESVPRAGLGTKCYEGSRLVKRKTLLYSHETYATVDRKGGRP